MDSWWPDAYAVGLTGIGLLIALVAWLPLALRSVHLSLPIVCILVGGLAYLAPYIEVDPSPQAHPYITERMTEFVVIVALMGAGLKIDRRFSFKGWAIAWKLLLITMPLSILATIFIGTGILGLSTVSTLLLAASLSPTDPVLAEDIQVGAPLEGGEDAVRLMNVTNLERCPVSLRENDTIWYANHQDPAFAETTKSQYAHHMPSLYAPKIVEKWQNYFETGVRSQGW